MSTWLVMVLAGLGTYLLRVSMVVAHDRFGTPRWLESNLRLIGPSVLAAILVSSLILSHGHRTGPRVSEVIAVTAAYVAVRRRGTVSAALVVGFPVYWLCLALPLAA